MTNDPQLLIADSEVVRPPVNLEPARLVGQRVAANLLLGLFGVLFALPMLWLVLASLDSQATWSIEIPQFTLKNFTSAFSENGYSLYNSLVLGVVSTVIATGAGTLGAYALSRKRIPWKGPLLLGVLFLSGFPLSILIIPIYQMFATVGWLSLLPCALFLSITSLPFEIYLIKNFIDAVPEDLEEAARVERASTLQVLLRVVLPLSLPGIGAAAIYGFVNSWGSFLVPLVLIGSPSDYPGPIAIFGYIGAAHVEYGNIAAFSLIYALPVVLLYAASSRLFSGGFVLAGAVRG
jgi:multiple sugar transport system permease protein